MQPPSKSKTWANEDPTAHNLEVNEGVVDVITHISEAPSEDEYRPVPEIMKDPKKVDETELEMEKISPGSSREKVTQTSLKISGSPTTPGKLESTNETRATTDDDWLRSRTSRLLGLIEDKELDEELNAQIQSDSRVAESTNFTDQENRLLGLAVSPGPKTEEVETTCPKMPAEDPNIALIGQTSRLFIRNLPYDISEDDLSQHFSSKGELSEVSSVEKISFCSISGTLPRDDYLIGTTYVLYI